MAYLTGTIMGLMILLLLMMAQPARALETDCLSTGELARFLNMLDVPIVTEGERITVFATDRITVWEWQGGAWCHTQGQPA